MIPPLRPLGPPRPSLFSHPRCERPVGRGVGLGGHWEGLGRDVLPPLTGTRRPLVEKGDAAGGQEEYRFFPYRSRGVEKIG